MNPVDGIFLVRTEARRHQQQLFEATAAACRPLGITVWTYEDFQFTQRKIDYGWSGGTRIDPVRYHAGLPPIEIDREEPDPDAVLALWRQSAAIVVLEDPEWVTEGVGIELDMLERGYLRELGKSAPLVVAVTVDGDPSEPVIRAPVALRHSLLPDPGSDVSQKELIGLCLMCWCIQRLLLSVRGAFILSQAANASDLLAVLARSSSLSKEYDFAELQVRNQKIAGAQQKAPSSSILQIIDRLATDPLVNRMSETLGSVSGWLIEHDTNGPLCAAGAILGRCVLDSWTDASNRFSHCTPFWMKDLGW
jgi:hypothetical protein